ncbi:hypothetical protein GpartN1_g1125.t1 [Galdieria partita]|uniref:E3 ubiquitin-protein ligase listerin n=1 Tax=Galdieria partita TaxID=83374 RepID=A0A9C7PSA6_9RHOD|nr:hypothetical protein GpartN1_g1125.t1 [Galdieria partita]
MKGKRGKRPSSSSGAASLLPQTVLKTNFTSLAEATESIARLNVAEIETEINSKDRTPWVDEGLQCIRYLLKKDANTRQKKLLELKNIILSVNDDEGRDVRKSRELVEAFSRVVERLLLWEREPRIRINALEVIDAMFERFREGTVPFLDKVIPALLASRADVQREVAKKTKQIYFSHFNTDAKRKKLIYRMADSIGNFFKQYSKVSAEQQADKSESNGTVEVALGCVYSALEDLAEVTQEESLVENILEKLLDITILQRLIERSKNADWQSTLFDLLAVSLRIVEKQPNGQFALYVASSSFIHTVLSALLNESSEPALRKSILVIHCLLQVHFKKPVLDSSELNSIVNWVRKRILSSNRTLLTCIRILSVLFEDLFKAVDEDGAKFILEGVEMSFIECLNAIDWQQEELSSALLSLYLDCVRFRVINWQVSSDMTVDSQELVRYLKTFWYQIVFCKIPSCHLLSNSLLKQICEVACDAYLQEHFKNSLSCCIEDSISSSPEDDCLSWMKKLEMIGIFLYRNCPRAKTVIPDNFQSFIEKDPSGKLLLKLKMLKVFCVLNDKVYNDFVERQIEIFLSNTAVLENKELNYVLLSCLEHYVASAETDMINFVCRNVIVHCSLNFFSLFFVSLVRTLSPSSFLKFVEDSQFQEMVLSTLEDILTNRSLSGQEEVEFLSTFVSVWMEYNQPLLNPGLLLNALLKNTQFFELQSELLRKCLVLLAKNSFERDDWVEIWMSIAFRYLPLLKDDFFEHIWSRLEIRWSVDTKVAFNSELCLNLATLFQTLSCSEDAIEYAKLFHSSFCSIQHSNRISDQISSFLVDLEGVLYMDSNFKSVILTFVCTLLTPQLLKVFSVVGVERLGKFLSCVLLRVENEVGFSEKLLHSVKQYLRSVPYDIVEDTVVYIFMSSYERLKGNIEIEEPFHCLQEILSSTMEILHSSIDREGKKLSYDLVESNKFLFNDFCFFVVFHLSNLAVDSNDSKLLQMTLESLLSQLVLLYNSNEQSSTLSQLDRKSSKARLRTVLIFKRIILSNPQALQTKWAQFAVDIISGLKRMEMRRSYQSQQMNISYSLNWNREELRYIFHTMDSLFLFALGQDWKWHDKELVIFMKNVAEGALEEMHNLLLSSEAIDKDYFSVSCAACSILLEFDTLQKSVPEHLYCDYLEVSDKSSLFALQILFHVIIHKPMLQMEHGIVSIAKLARKYPPSKLTDASLLIQCYDMLHSLNQEIRSTGYTLLVEQDPGYLIADICHSEEEPISWFGEEIEKLLSFPLSLDELDVMLQVRTTSSELNASRMAPLYGYFLTWVLFLNYKSQGYLEFNRILSEYLREHFQLFDAFMTFITEYSIFRMNDSPLQLQRVIADSASTSCKENYLEVNELLFEAFCDVHTWFSSCAKAFGFCLAQLPALSRRWYNDTLANDRRAKVEIFVRRHITASIVEREFNLLQVSFEDTQGTGGSLQLKPVSITREVTAIYSFTDTRIEIVLKLPEEFPLSLVSVEPKTAIGMAESKWRKTVLAMSSLLSMKDGNLRDAIDLWRRNLDRQFEGVEECPICYSILHISNGTLPRLECTTCKHKFHAACLYKWLQSSATSSCPLCRTVGRFFK